MQIVIDIPSKWFDDMVREKFTEVDELCAVIQHGTPLPKVRAEVLDKIKAEIEQVEINGYIRDVECFVAGLNTASKIIDKYREMNMYESEVKNG